MFLRLRQPGWVSSYLYVNNWNLALETGVDLEYDNFPQTIDISYVIVLAIHKLH